MAQRLGDGAKVIRAFLLFFSAGLLGLSARNCEGDGFHAEINVNELKIQYAGHRDTGNGRRHREARLGCQNSTNRGGRNSEG